MFTTRCHRSPVLPPQAARVPLTVGRLEAGDLLYLPSYWWHIVDSLPRRLGSERGQYGPIPPGGRNLMISLQFSHPGLALPGGGGRELPPPAFSHDIIRWSLRIRSRSALCKLRRSVRNSTSSGDALQRRAEAIAREGCVHKLTCRGRRSLLQVHEGARSGGRP